MFHYSCAFFIFQIEVPLKIFTKGWPLLRQLGKNFELKSLNLLYFFINDTQKNRPYVLKNLFALGMQSSHAVNDSIYISLYQ